VPESQGASDQSTQAEQYDNKKRCARDAGSPDQNEGRHNKPADRMAVPLARSLWRERHNSWIRVSRPRLSCLPE
jgi:hypothetical protein